ncbi:MAG: hypothetical protein ACRDOU_18965 [Streptosporangiaceae bacterium]
MLRAGQVGLRARDEADVPVLHAELYEDIAIRVQADSRPWRPIPAGAAGFVPEGKLRGAAWVNGEWADEVLLGMLATDWERGGNRLPGEGEIPGS